MSLLGLLINELYRHYRRWKNRRARAKRVIYTWHDERNFSQRKYYLDRGTL